MATADDEVIMLDGGEFFIEADEGSILETDVYEAYANVIGRLSGEVQAREEEVRTALEASDAMGLLESSVNMRLALAAFDGAMAMMEALGLNPEVKVEVEVEHAEG